MAGDLIEALILAAGAASRFGSPKALAPWGDRCLLAQVIHITQAAVGVPPWVVLGAAEDDIVSTLESQDCQYRAIPNPDWAQGLSTSLQRGLTRIQLASPQLQGVMVVLGDQPCLQSHELQALITLWLSSPDFAVAAEHAGEPGAPCILPRRLFNQIASLSGDQGARALLRNDPQVRTLPLPNAIWDIDTPQDLLEARLRLDNHRT